MDSDSKNVADSSDGFVKIEIEEVDDVQKEKNSSQAKRRKTKPVVLAPVRKSQRQRKVTKDFPSFKKETKSSSKKTFYYVQKFRKEWLDEDDFKPWLSEVDGDISKGYCNWCCKVINARYHEIKRHGSSQKHVLFSHKFKKEAVRKSPKVEPKKTKNKQKNLVDLLKDISAITEELSDEDSTFNMYDEKENKTSSSAFDVSSLLKEQIERTSLVSAFLCVQEERLELDLINLENARKRFAFHQSILETLSTKLSDVHSSDMAL